MCLDAVHYLKYRRAGETDSPLAWEFAPVESWETAPDPGQVAKRVLVGFTQRKLPDRSAWLTSTIAHWTYGSVTSAAYGILGGSLPSPHPEYGVPLAPRSRWGCAIRSHTGFARTQPWPTRSASRIRRLQ